MPLPINNHRAGRTNQPAQQANANRPGDAARGPLSRAAARVGQAMVRPDDFYRLLANGTPLPPPECWRIPGSLACNLLRLNLSNMQLHSLPNHLPPNLRALNVSQNQLQTLPNQLPQNLGYLNVSRNQLNTLPNQLPQNLSTLDVSRNQLQTLPNQLPPNLSTLLASENLLREVDVDLFRQLPRNANVYIQLNPLPPQAVTRLDSLLRQADYEGPQIHYPSIQETYQAQWAQWASEPHDASEQRDRAIDRLNNTLRSAQEPDRDEVWLGLNDLGLSTVPPLPEGVTHLELFSNRLNELPNNLPRSLVCLSPWNNQLTRLPEDLPDNLTELRAAGNQLTSLPDNLPRNLVTIYLNDNRLTRLPENMPNNLTKLEASNNQLSILPGNLPRNLVHMGLKNNRLTRLPQNLPRNLVHMGLDNNRLTSLPQRLPNSIRRLDAAGNQLTTLSDSHLYTPLGGDFTIVVTRNPLSRETINRLDALRNNPQYNGAVVHYTSYHEGRPLDVVLQSNPVANAAPQAAPTERAATPHPDVADAQPLALGDFDRALDEAVLAALNTPIPEEFLRIRQDAEDAGNPIPPMEFLRMVIEQMTFERPMNTAHAQAIQASPQGLPADPAADLGQAAAAWAQPPQINITDTRRLWQCFANQPGAPQFAQFLNRLRQTVNVNEPAFQHRVAQWLTQLEINSSLREDTFAVSIGATESCEDRISLTYNTMRKLSMAADVSGGNYDQRLPELIALARGMFRLEQLENIARATTTALVRTHGANRVDEIEVYLGYQVMLREPLALPVSTTNMAFFRSSRLTQNDLNHAQAWVQAAEQQEFADYLSTNFAPWQEVIQRLAPELHEQAQDQLIEAMGNEFTRRLNTQLQDMALQNDPDAERTLGAQVRADIAREVYGQLTRDFLDSQGMLNLLR